MRSARSESRLRARTAFTLVHLLVLIAIFALLIAFLVPHDRTYSAEQANLALCKDNLRKIGGALILYAACRTAANCLFLRRLKIPMLNCLIVCRPGKFAGDPKDLLLPEREEARFRFQRAEFQVRHDWLLLLQRVKRQRRTRH